MHRLPTIQALIRVVRQRQGLNSHSENAEYQNITDRLTN